MATRDVEQRNAEVVRNLGLAYRFARRYGGAKACDSLDRADVEQEAAIGLMSAVTTHDSTRGTLSTWAYFAARHYCQQAGKRQPVWQQVPAASDGTEIEQVAPPDDTDVEGRLDLWSALAGLDERSRRVLTLRFGLEGKPEKSLHEVAEALGLSYETIRQCEIRALLTLREQLSP